MPRTVILPVFATAPIHVMQIKSGVPPLQIHLNDMRQRAAAWLAAKIDASNPMHERLPDQNTTNEATRPHPFP